jgi:hypothetical protein
MNTADLPLGKWHIFGNEELGELVITSLDTLGNLEGTVFGDKISGRFHASSGNIHFLRVTGTPPPLHSGDTRPYTYVFQIYSGHLSTVAKNVDISQYLLAGSYVTLLPPSVPASPDFGWYATISIKAS